MAAYSGAARVVNVEFVSANPTGPLHVGHGRQAALGDAISTLLEYSGWKVTREFYYNDAGVQIENLAASVEARLAELGGKPTSIPEGGYHGEYIRELADRYRSDGNGLSIREFAVRELRKEQDLDLQAFGVRFDHYFLESSLYTDGMVDDTVRLLVASGTYEHDGAVAPDTEFGDDRIALRRATDLTIFPGLAYQSRLEARVSRATMCKRDITAGSVCARDFRRSDGVSPQNPKFSTKW